MTSTIGPRILSGYVPGRPFVARFEAGCSRKSVLGVAGPSKWSGLIARDEQGSLRLEYRSDTSREITVINNFSRRMHYTLDGKGRVISEEALGLQLSPTEHLIPDEAPRRHIEGLECALLATPGHEAWISVKLQHVVEERVVNEQGVECVWRMHDIELTQPPSSFFEP